MKMSEKISIIVPIYNVKQYLTCCLNSLINQTYQNIEILCVDDGSTDGSSDICDKYAEVDSRVRVVTVEYPLLENVALIIQRAIISCLLMVMIGLIAILLSYVYFMRENFLQNVFCFHMQKNMKVSL